jgi:flavin reductase (DIM6/NTAB) family NADH-FMN oxidoreductase RutF
MVALDDRQLRACLGSFPTGVTILTYELDAEVRGATVSSFVSVSLAPPLVLACINKSARSYDALQRSSFTVNILSSTQRAHALHFSGRRQSDLSPRFEEGVVGRRIADCLAYVSCDPWAVHEAGDHTLVIGEVVDIESAAEAITPLLFYRSDFWTIGAPLTVEAARGPDPPSPASLSQVSHPGLVQRMEKKDGERS